MGLQRVGLHAEHPIRVEIMPGEEFDDDQRVHRAIGLLVEPGPQLASDERQPPGALRIKGMARLTGKRFASAQTFDQAGRNLAKGLAVLGIRRHERDRRSGRHEVAGRVRHHRSLARKRVTVAQRSPRHRRLKRKPPPPERRIVRNKTTLQNFLEGLVSFLRRRQKLIVTGPTRMIIS